MPASLPSVQRRAPATVPDVARRLAGGDRRSIGAADAVAGDAIADPSLVAPLVAGLSAADPVVRMRCADALEKATRARPEHLGPHTPKLLALLAAPQPREVRWHLLQMAPRLRWTGAQARILLPAVEDCLRSDSSIVRTCAMQALAELALQFPARRARIVALLSRLAVTGTPAMRSRGAKLLRALRATAAAAAHPVALPRDRRSSPCRS